MALINTDFQSKQKSHMINHYLWAKMQFSDGEVPTKSVIIRAILIYFEKVPIYFKSPYFKIIICNISFDTFPNFFQTFQNIVKTCQKLLIVLHLSELYDVPAGCIRKELWTGHATFSHIKSCSQ